MGSSSFPSLSIDYPKSNVWRLTSLRMKWWSFPLWRVDPLHNKIPVVVPNHWWIRCQYFLQGSVCPYSFSLWRGWFYRSDFTSRIPWSLKWLTWESHWTRRTFRSAGKPVLFLWASLSHQLHVYCQLLQPSFLNSNEVSAWFAKFASMFE